MQGPVVIVLDALDECGTEKTRRSLMESFWKALPELPKNFRFLITSRKEPDINRAFSGRPHRILTVELEHGSEHYLPIPDDWQWKIDRLATAAAGLFIWASTAVKLVDCDNPAPKLKNLVSDSQHLTGLEQLYDSVLMTSGISFDDESSQVRFSQVVGLILLSRSQLTDDTIDGLLGFLNDEPSRLILSRLQSVLVFTRGEPIHFCHTSFHDYLVSAGRESDPWFIDIETQKKLIALRCFDVMRGILQFNICSIASSYIPNEQIPDLPDRIKASIPSHLEYTCLFWSQHLLETPFSHVLLDELSEFLDEHLLYWLEVMSLLEKVNIAGPALLHAMNWVSSHNADVLSFLRDARRMIIDYCIYAHHFTIDTAYIRLFPSVCIEGVEFYKQIGVKQRSPLLKKLAGHRGYVYSVAFSPDSTRVASGSYDRTIRIWDAEIGRAIFGPFKGHKGYIQSVAFSPDGARVVSGSNDKSIRILDVENGQMISGPMEGHTGHVYLVAFLLDNPLVPQRPARGFGARALVESRQAVKHFKGHKGAVLSIVLSPNGKHIVSSSADKTIQIWEIEIAFSGDSTRVASGSADRTIRIWDAQSGECISESFEGHTEPVTSVAFSPDGKSIASGSHDKTVRIWDIESRQVVSGPFEGHTNWVRSVAFSPNRSRVVSGSNNNTIRIWDAESVQAVSGDFEGRTAEVTSVAISPDYISTFNVPHTDRSIPGARRDMPSIRRAGNRGDPIRTVLSRNPDTTRLPFLVLSKGTKAGCRFWSVDGTRVASGSSDKTLRIWDIATRQTISGPFKGHEDWVYSVAFSPDGRHVVSGSDDTTIIVWDVKSGEIISRLLIGHKDQVCSVAFSSDGTRIVSGSADQNIFIWNVESGQVVAGPFNGHTGRVSSVAFRDLNRTVQYGYDPFRSRPVQSTVVPVYSTLGSLVAFSCDGTHIISGSDDRTICVWGAHSGQAIFVPFEGHTAGVCSVAFSSDGRGVISGSLDFNVWYLVSDFVLNIDPIFDWKMDEDGWICTGKGELLLWIPPDLQPTLWRLQNIAVLGCSFSTRLDFSNAALGRRWQEHFGPPQ
ncbi:WD40 repeat-like protein [Fomitiporia mediterranea MF3/22]|uniref:WD40 repeat-like protein n=1 Tax=Fomitiporia mediterranea (strain MF3/22) TaxID=694068 RepID=UPI00044072D1|nr:WD40 repeat-like protein [Fomitiporia mediterranea MF3/22]EJD05297.1 WD40 repeat-like protein [Fomitiporia mediterranea MF3/22]